METHVGSYELSQECFADEVADILLGEEDTPHKAFIVEYLHDDTTGSYTSLPEYDHMYCGLAFLSIDISRMEHVFERIGLDEETFFELYDKLESIPEHAMRIPKEIILAKVRLLAAVFCNGLEGMEKELELMKGDFREGIVDSYAADNLPLPPQLKIGLSGRDRDYYEYARASFADQTVRMQNMFDNKIRETLQNIEKRPDSNEMLKSFRKIIDKGIDSFMEYLHFCVDKKQFRAGARWDTHPDHMLEDMMGVAQLRHFLQQQQDTD